MRETFLSFFENKGHKRITPYPVVARWRDDIYFTHASIIDFQPYVTEGIIPPPANPLVISQPCMRFADLDNVGPTFGRHLTIFEMGGHHAFNYPEKEVYWKDETVRYHHEFVTDELGVNSEEVIYKEGVWSGGGNAGPDVESIIRGLEVATLVFMKFKVVGNEFIELPIRTVDTGYGIERYTWLSQGSVSGFHAVYEPILNKIFEMANIGEVDSKLLSKTAKFSGLTSLERTADRLGARKKIARHLGITIRDLDKTLYPIENSFVVADHTRCLVFMLAEGIVPSNAREGYLARLMLRRTYKSLRTLEIEERFLDIVDMQITHWSQDFPRLKEMRNEIFEIISVERDKFNNALKRGRGLVKRISRRLKAKGAHQIPVDTLIELYDSHGLPPEIVREAAEEEGVRTNIPDNFYMTFATKHDHAPPISESELQKDIKDKIISLPETQRLYYEEPGLSEFEAEVLQVINGEYVIFDKTAFYPEGGGQPPDLGYLEFDKTRSEVIDVQKIGNIITHVVKGAVPEVGEKIRGVIDWERRKGFMKHHTATHILVGAAKRVLGEHVWQAGAQKGIERSRLDISHFKRLTLEEVHEIERLANQVVMKNIPVETLWMLREDAEKLHGFRLYQGGVVPGREIRVVKVGDWNVEACGGTHCKTTGEVGLIKLVHTERIQDGVERLVFSIGLSALKVAQDNEKILWKVSKTLTVPLEDMEEAAKHLVEELKEVRRERERLTIDIAKFTAREYLKSSRSFKRLKVVTQTLHDVDSDRLIKTANELIAIESNIVVTLIGINKTARIVVMVGKGATRLGINAREIVDEVATVIGGGGNGNPVFAQGGGTQIEKIPEALKKVEEVIRKQSEG